MPFAIWSMAPSTSIRDQHSLAWPYLSTSEAILSKVGLERGASAIPFAPRCLPSRTKPAIDAFRSLETAATIIPSVKATRLLALAESQQSSVSLSGSQDLP